MKRSFGIFCIACIPFLLLANNNLSGYWTAEERNVTLIIEETLSGFKAKRTDRNEWYYYSQEGRDRYIDNLGNSYQILNNSTIVFYNNKGRNLTFRRKNSTNRDSYYNDQNYDDYERDRSYNNSRSRNGLEGQWINESSGQKIIIKSNRQGLKVKAIRRDKWTYFRPNNRGVFIDDRGNTYTIQNRSIVYESFNGDFRMRFRKY